MEIGQANRNNNIHKSCWSSSISRGIQGSSVAKNNARDLSQTMQDEPEVQTNDHI